MDSSFTNDELTIMHQFDYVCKQALKHQLIDYQRQKSRQKKNEVLWSEASKNEMDNLWSADEYSVEYRHFCVLGYDIEIKDILLAEALQALSERYTSERTRKKYIKKYELDTDWMEEL